jgi:ribose-phosphate pyrophosphokinase
MDQKPLIFALGTSHELGSRIAGLLGTALSQHEEREFEDGEHKARPLVSVRDRDVFVIHSLYGDSQQTVNDKLCRLLFFVGALRDASAADVTIVAPYLCYARKDRKTKPRDPVTTRYVARLMESVGAGRVITMDVHNVAAFQNAFSIPAEDVSASTLFVSHFESIARGSPLAVVSPDAGGIRRTRPFLEALERVSGRTISPAFLEKQRSSGVVSGELFAGEVEGKTAIILDDLISSGTTLVRAAQACRARGARRVIAVATHGVFSSAAEQVLSDDCLDSIVVTNTVSRFWLSHEFQRRKLTVLDVAPLLAETIRRVHEGGSLTELIEL